ncbi:hypothetical protein K435DRAFT_823279 [Dendrothele bispora CBS 962.96]|uniref:CxC1-like cysteine cluster associated with KDZ transposases domain-containing protein n=1 Tax=Dendrothele bispora (strain CBS 962.96) TaxID=1314807 RepID=A0A4S8L157_DENBC|nr:hypothetical protein K435DRAFT_823279 [Dendrothele bispora CBS 962.96]
MGSPSKSSRSTRQKKEQQAKNWLEKVIPKLTGPFMNLLQETENIRREGSVPARLLCNCPFAHNIDVLVVRFDKIEEVKILYCPNCELVAVQLVRSGLFPSVDIRMLDFVTRFFLCVSPNHTAWCNALEDYLGSQGYRIHGTDPLHQQFANALMWFNSLQNAVCMEVKSAVDGFRSVTRSRDDNEVEDPDNKVLPGFRRKRKRDDSSPCPDPGSLPTTNDGASETGVRPSDYLRSRCPLCFGGTTPPDLSDGWSVFVYTHNDQNRKDLCHVHPDTMFISPERVREMEEYVENRRSSKEQKRPHQDNDTVDDHFEHGMKVPKSALDSCGQSFDAANGTAKSRAKGFDERALAGMFCPHGSCLYLVTMSSLGEKQHYILVMLQTLFENIPRSWTVGFLYDVGCQVERSCRKWGFLEEYMERIIWGVSVFHEWACQLVYHPRKCKGFGLCDGETCEQCWHAINHLIAYTRVAGYHVRLYTLDSQFHFNNEQALLNAGKWLCRKNQQCETRHRAAQEIVDNAGYLVAVLREQWANQVRSQTKPLPRQQKQAAKKAVEETLRLRKNVEVYKQRVIDLETLMVSDSSRSDQRAMAEEDLLKAKGQLRTARQKLAQQERHLGIPERRELKQLVSSPFLTKRMNALSLKIRLRQRLRTRKFELDRLERSYRKQHSEQRLDDHTREAVQRREPGILSLANKYNKLCDEMAELIQQHRAPQHAIAPKKIERESLFDLDVDEDIWQDLGLDDTEDPPLWLCNEDVQKGIRALLELDRCVEERARLCIQRRALQEWFGDEWDVMRVALEHVKNLGLRHQLEQRRVYFLKLYMTWEKPLVELSDNYPTEWGPSQEELREARLQIVSDAVDGEDVRETADFDVNFEEDVDAALVEKLDTFEVIESFRGVDIEDND